ncbi:hypothetical protein CgunFtcFv8_010311 [Champsocephalus gunnari]|uniref:Uncharacterized protein n=1 Tax=Champsocephalus gunnari TaxID=52237 RepID=A0AAN8DUM3_CHAGU|nr:hypothetical protein CgunFtcFv8_010311 [Champsocephalus gunnari]
MSELGIAVVPTRNGMKAIRIFEKCKKPEPDLYVVDGVGPPTYFYSFDLITQGPREVTKALWGKTLQVSKELSNPLLDLNKWEDMKIINFVSDAGLGVRDLHYENKFFKEPHVQLAIKNFYWSDAGFCGVSVGLPRKDRAGFRSWSIAHVALSKPKGRQWREVVSPHVQMII